MEKWKTYSKPANMEIFNESMKIGLPNGYLFICGGFQNVPHKSYTNITIFYDYTSNTCAYAKSMNRARSGAALICRDGFVYCMGGISYNSEILNHVERYNIRVNRWEELDEMHEKRCYATA